MIIFENLSSLGRQIFDVYLPCGLIIVLFALLWVAWRLCMKDKALQAKIEAKFQSYTSKFTQHQPQNYL